MNIAIDIDDTIMDSFDYFIPYVAEYFGVEVDYLKEKNISYGNLPQEWKKEELNFARRYYDHVVVDTPIKPDALEYINWLHEQGHKIIIITARNEDLYTAPYKTTREELEKNNIKYDKLICTMDKAQACIDEQVELFIDDSIKNCQSVKAVGIRTLLFESKANMAELVDLPRVRNWKDVYEIIR